MAYDQNTRYLNNVAHTGGEDVTFGPRRNHGNSPTHPPTVFNYQRARHPEYADRNNRLFSFVTWRYSHVQDPTHLANYGFFYTGEIDLVRCYFCSIGLKEFISSDDPLLEHIRYSGDCGHLIELLGPTRLQEIKDTLKQGLNRTGENQPSGNGQSRTAVPRSHPPTSSEARSQEVTRPYRHPEYISYSVRVASFVGWPTHLVQTPQSLAEAGLYYTGTRDVVRCYACDGGLEKWDPTDDPWIEHCINFPECRHLKETKGDAYIALALSHRRQPTTIDITPISPQAIANGLNGLHLQGERPRNRQHPSNTRTLVQQVAEMGFEPVVIHRAVDSLRKGKQERTIEAIIDKIESFTKVDEALTEKRSPKELFEENKALLKQLFCMQCKTADNNALFLPCQHHRYCMACSDSLTTCPICGRSIVQRIKTYRP